MPLEVNPETHPPDDLAIRHNDLTGIVKYAADTTPLVKVCKNEIDLSQEVFNQFFSWTQDNAIRHVIPKDTMN